MRLENFRFTTGPYKLGSHLGAKIQSFMFAPRVSQSFLTTLLLAASRWPRQKLSECLNRVTCRSYHAQERDEPD